MRKLSIPAIKAETKNSAPDNPYNDWQFPEFLVKQTQDHTRTLVETVEEFVPSWGERPGLDSIIGPKPKRSAKQLKLDVTAASFNPIPPALRFNVYAQPFNADTSAANLSVLAPSFEPGQPSIALETPPAPYAPSPIQSFKELRHKLRHPCAPCMFLPSSKPSALSSEAKPFKLSPPITLSASCQDFEPSSSREEGGQEVSTRLSKLALSSKARPYMPALI
mmetsp:Transcript_2731/g.6037  ORF Transcript_2731/g.6037 Transcript_2731/m.6037 type:complete len:221 (+) Transcript_2731:50-712(+)